MRKFLSSLLCVVALVSLTACGSSDSTKPDDPGGGGGSTNKYAYGTWLTTSVLGNGHSYDIVFKTDMTFIATAGHRPTPTISGTYSIDADGTAKGDFTGIAPNTRKGVVAMRFVDAAATTLNFTFTETNAFDNPDAVKGVISEDFQGKNTDPPPAGGGGGGNPPPPGNSADAIDPATIVWDGGPSPASWPITAEMTDLAIKANGTAGCTVHNPAECETIGPCVFFNFTNPASWPQTGKIIGSGWVIGKINGVWHAGVWEAIKPGGSYFTTTEQCPNQSQQFIQSTGAVAGHHFEKGEEIGFVFSTVARGPHPDEPKGRSPIIKTTYPF
jgi:hypothetical protein